MPASEEKEKEKLEKHQDLRREFARLWHVNAAVTHLVVRALGIVMINLQRTLQQIGVTVTERNCRKWHYLEPQESCESQLET